VRDFYDENCVEQNRSVYTLLSKEAREDDDDDVDYMLQFHAAWFISVRTPARYALRCRRALKPHFRLAYHVHCVSKNAPNLA